jgi:hypothetical protein
MAEISTQRSIDSLIRDFARRVSERATLPVVHKAFSDSPLGALALTPVAPPPEKQEAPIITRAEAVRADIIFQAAAQTAFKRVLKAEPNGTLLGKKAVEICQTAFNSAIKMHCGKILAAAKVKPGAFNSIMEQKAKAKLARKELAAELRSGRKRLSNLQWKIAHADDVAERLVEARRREKVKGAREQLANALVSARARLKALRNSFDSDSHTLVGYARSAMNDVIIAGSQYPEIPLPTFKPTPNASGLPSAPGIYFLWVDDVVEYVGQSIRLCDRLRLGMHHVLNERHRISVVFVDRKELTWAECYYIGALRPHRNFGASASHYEPPD